MNVCFPSVFGLGGPDSGAPFLPLLPTVVKKPALTKGPWGCPSRMLLEPGLPSRDGLSSSPKGSFYASGQAATGLSPGAPSLWSPLVALACSPGSLDALSDDGPASCTCLALWLTAALCFMVPCAEPSLSSAEAQGTGLGSSVLTDSLTPPATL